LSRSLQRSHSTRARVISSTSNVFAKLKNETKKRKQSQKEEVDNEMRYLRTVSFSVFQKLVRFVQPLVNGSEAFPDLLFVDNQRRVGEDCVPTLHCPYAFDYFVHTWVATKHRISESQRTNNLTRALQGMYAISGVRLFLWCTILCASSRWLATSNDPISHSVNKRENGKVKSGKKRIYPNSPLSSITFRNASIAGGGGSVTRATKSPVSVLL
jgi:hypothetical protein